MCKCNGCCGPTIRLHDQFKLILLAIAGTQSKMSVFKYRDLKSKDSIRLLSLLHDDDNSVISCKLYNVRLDKPKYVAVSYSWGDSCAEKCIIIDDQPFSIRENVWALLQQMRTHKTLKWRYFWIDAICINQLNVTERNH
ncbi:hypothetical protein DL95DRAFT_496372 [Leptodontidium sp. 2 PMI_412]|nr:hypothetical protein DL95DRAFT_496372 [Leptodontidium sp. 2 PMI_412]